MLKNPVSVRLTAKQKKLKAEIESFCMLTGNDHWNIENYPTNLRTTQLTLMKDHIIRGRVIMRYTQIDELLSTVIAKAYFPEVKREQDFHGLWRTRRFRSFSHHVLDGLYLLQKLRLVHDLRTISPKVRDIVERLNAVRNALAHSFYPTNRYQYRNTKKMMWLGNDLFSLAGFAAFELQSQQLVDYFLHRAYGIKSRSLTAIPQ